MKIVIETIPHSQQRYPTVGDWLYGEDHLHIYVSEMHDWRREALVGVHELIEALLCNMRGIPEPAVKAFDEAHPDASDPGSLPDAPYHREHMCAEGIEFLLAMELGVNWQEYGAAVEALFE